MFQFEMIQIDKLDMSDLNPTAIWSAWCSGELCKFETASLATNTIISDETRPRQVFTLHVESCVHIFFFLCLLPRSSLPGRHMTNNAAYPFAKRLRIRVKNK